MTFGNRTTRIPGINLSVRREGSCLAALLSEPTKAQSFVNEHSQQPTAKCAFRSKSGRIARGRKPTAFDGVLGLVGAAEDAACYKVQQPPAARELGGKDRSMFLSIQNQAVSVKLRVVRLCQMI